MKRIEQQQVKTRQILAAAERLFLEHGYVGTTMDAVAEEAAVTKQTVYRYFPSKADLVIALIEGDDDGARTFAFGDGGAGQELERYGVAFLSEHMTPHNLGFFRMMMTEARDHGELGEIFRTRAQPSWRDGLVRFLSDHLDRPVDPAMADLFNSMLLSQRTAILMGNRPPMSAEEIASHVALVVGVFLHGAGMR
ncbi:transcriptional regulator, TetR family [Cohaesibacter sp. ES.047]|uniref:TetR/AcrR family transcriptional regulator n=1 Tax=Cohaesibacter sp. ES.047 TaxID=1798205 RepID=UPI000BC09B63|nr:TetR/AcrR family transcriptional regulator [Cohaesibacter sp. ES.047]SNY94134.1 transcriptional regulator, TetR family [Cohaesibacter sp. ES.047]